VPAPDIRSSEFWRAEGLLLWEELRDLVMRGLLIGANGGRAALPASVQPLVNWDFYNRAAIRYLREYRFDQITGITETTRKQVIEAMEDWLRSGEHLDGLRDRLAPVFGKTRADMIAQTEVTRVVARGNIMLWESTGFVSGKRWMTARDERVCPICRPLHMQLVEIDKGWTFSAQDVADNEELRKALGGVTAITYLHPPAHVNCRCWMQPFVSEELVDEQVERILRGEE
jgi:uncharacterized protein with gpF-like domain